MENKEINSAEIASQLNVISGRSETLSIIINLLNHIFNITQKSSNPVSDEIISAIQAAINAESDKTKELFANIESVIGKDFGSIGNDENNASD